MFDMLNGFSRTQSQNIFAKLISDHSFLANQTPNQRVMCWTILHCLRSNMGVNCVSGLVFPPTSSRLKELDLVKYSSKRLR